MHNSSSAYMPKFLNLFVGYDQDSDQEGVNSIEFADGTYTYDPEKTLNYNAEQLLIAMGVEKDTIEKIRGIMLPGYAEGKLEEVEMVNKGWQ